MKSRMTICALALFLCLNISTQTMAQSYKITITILDTDGNPLISRRGRVFGVFLSVSYPPPGIPEKIRVHWTNLDGYAWENIEIRPEVEIRNAYLYDGLSYKHLEIIDVKRIGPLHYSITVQYP